jgi:Holliday junction resolvase
MKLFIAHSYAEARQLADRLSADLSEAGHDVFRPAPKASEDVLPAISAALRRSDLVIALLTTDNPNVYFEIGLAAGVQVPTLIAADDLDHVTFDLASAPYVQLTGDLDEDVREIVRRVSAMVPKSIIRERLSSAESDLSPVETLQDVSALEGVSPAEFERLVAEIFRSKGVPVRESPGPGSGGFDLIIEGELLTVVEVKRYRQGSLVAVGAVRQLLGAMTAIGAHRAILVTSSGFTSSAIAAASEWPIDLMDREELIRFSLYEEWSE